jgi:cytochrome c oxidase cbb3-type subunit 3
MTRRGWLALLACLAATCGNPEPVALDARAGMAEKLTEWSVDSGAADRERGRKIWNFRCYFCHGYSGDARTLASTYLDPPPRDFTRADAQALTLPQLRAAITDGRAGTAMKAFGSILSPAEIIAVAGFVQREFIGARAENTRYHTAENGWPDHERHRAAFAFARGDLALDTPWEQLDDEQRRGKRLFLTACISCHDRARVDNAGAVWETRALSYPRDAYCTSCHAEPNGSGPRSDAARPADHPPSTTAALAPGADAALASTYSLHDRPPVLRDATALERQGETLYQRNCAFCHAADGTAKSWIGRFLEPHPRDLTDPSAMRAMTRERLVRTIEDGLDGTSMPGWKSVLQRNEIDAVAAYVQRAFQPTGSR